MQIELLMELLLLPKFTRKSETPRIAKEILEKKNK